MKHTVGQVTTELNAKKGIWCEFCGRDCSKEHLIRIAGDSTSGTLSNACVACAADLINCLRQSLTDAVLTEKEIV